MPLQILLKNLVLGNAFQSVKNAVFLVLDQINRTELSEPCEILDFRFQKQLKT